MFTQPRSGTLPLAGRAGEGGARPASLARKLRAHASPVEVRLWRIIYALRVDGYHFRKQVRIGSYVIDFACLHAGLVIEVDDRSHDGEVAQSNDAIRDDYPRSRGFRVLRFSNHEVMCEAEGVYTAIAAALQGRPRSHRRTAPPLPPSPARGEVSSGSGGNIEPRLATGAPTAMAGQGRATRSNPKPEHP